jgi:hypothetical protein
MSAGKAIYGKLTTTPEVTAILADAGGVPGVFPSKAVQFSAFPLIAYGITQGTNDVAFDASQGLSSHNMTVACVGETYDSAEALGDAAVAALNGGSGTWGGQTVQGCFVESVADAEEVEIENERIVWRKDVQVLIWIEA